MPASLDWDKLRIFYAVAHAGSFTKAEETLHISYSSISRHISQLERSFKVPLFVRHARGLKLTSAGEILLDSVRTMFDSLEATKNRISASMNSPMGYLNLSVPTGIAAEWLMPRIAKFSLKYPEVVIQMLYQDNLVNVSMGDADLSIRVCPPDDDSDAIWLPFLSINFGLYAHRDYLKVAGRPKKLEDLEKHRTIRLNSMQALPRSYFNRFFKDDIPPAITFDNAYGIYHAVKAGLGVGVVTSVMLQSPERMREDGLEPLFPHTAFQVQSYFVYPMELRGTQKIKLLRDFLSREAKEFEKMWEES